MIAILVQLAENLFQSYGAWGVFLASVLEEVFAPIPSALVMMGAGFSFLGNLPLSWSTALSLFLWVSLPAAAGITLGSLVVYVFSYLLGKPFLERWGKYLGLSWSMVERLQARFNRGWADEIVLFVMRALPAVPSVAVTALCGLTRLSPTKYILSTFFGTLIRASILGALGWELGVVYKTWADRLGQVESFLVGGIAVAVLGYVLYRLIRYRRAKQLA